MGIPRPCCHSLDQKLLVLFFLVLLVSIGCFLQVYIKQLGCSSRRVGPNHGSTVKAGPLAFRRRRKKQRTPRGDSAWSQAQGAWRHRCHFLVVDELVSGSSLRSSGQRSFPHPPGNYPRAQGGVLESSTLLTTRCLLGATPGYPCARSWKVWSRRGEG